MAKKLARPRIHELGAVSLLWGLPLAILTQQSGRAAAGAVLVGLAALLPLSVPLRPSDSLVINVATARRVVFATLAAVGLAGLWWLEFWVAHPFSLLLGAGTTWLVMAVSTRIKPLASTTPVVRVRSALTLPSPSLPLLSRISKRIVDIIVSATLILILAPALLVISTAIRLGDGGPAFFRQRRLAQDGGTFRMFKFRSMVIHAEGLQDQLHSSNERSGPLFKMSDDPRITPIGRVLRDLSLDELPQLFNILRGDMSLVGPRPALPHEAAKFDRQLARRVLVKPGLTGLWQAEARSDPDFGRFRDLDLRYLESCSPVLDLWILLATTTEVITAIVAIPLRLFGLEIRRVDGVAQTGPNELDLRDHHQVEQELSAS